MYAKFVLFGPQHLVVMALTLVMPLALSALTLHDPSQKRRVALGFAGLLIVTWIAWYALFIARHWITLANALPLNLCDWATIAALVALIAQRRKAYELAYYWSLAGTLQGLITPDVNYAFPEAQFVVFFAGHALIIASVIWLTAGSGFRPTPSSIPRAVAWSVVYAIVAGSVDWLLGVNYGFFRAKPGHATVFDFLSPWPGYIPELLVIGALATIILYAPWYFADQLKRLRVQTA